MKSCCEASVVVRSVSVCPEALKLEILGFQSSKVRKKAPMLYICEQENVRWAQMGIMQIQHICYFHGKNGEAQVAMRLIIGHGGNIQRRGIYQSFNRILIY